MTEATVADRVTTLEIRAAEQERAIEELSGQVAEQWREVEMLQRKLSLLTDRFAALQDRAGPEVPDDPPPHW